MSNLWVIPEELGDYADSEYAYEGCKVASYLMWSLSGRKFNNINTVTERYAPAVRETDRNERYNMNTSATAYYGTVPFTSRLPIDWLRLRGNPVQGVSKIAFVDSGKMLANTDYNIVDKTWINFKTAVSSPVSVTYRFGMPPPTAGRMAARHLAQEFSKLWAGDDDCELPDRVTSVTRQGVSMTVLDNQDFIQELRTGVYSVDLFLKSVNPDSARVRPKVFTPGAPRGRRTQEVRTGTGGWNIISQVGR